MTPLVMALPVVLQIIAFLSLGILLLLVGRSMTWDEFFVPGRLQQWLLAALALVAIWSLRVEAIEGLAMHFLGVAVVTLVFGWRLALFLMVLVLALLLLLGIEDLQTLPVTFWLKGVLPIVITMGLLRFCEVRMPPHLFIYLYGVGFLGGALSALLAMGGQATLYFFFTPVSWEAIFRDYLQYALLMVLPEGVLNGMIITALVLFRPEWVATYSDMRYLEGR
jgi:uncharacterized membrane protein